MDIAPGNIVRAARTFALLGVRAIRFADCKVETLLPKGGGGMDVSVIRMVVVFFGTLCLFSVGGIIYLSSLNREVPVALISVASSAVGSLAGILATQRQDDRDRR